MARPAEQVREAVRNYINAHEKNDSRLSEEILVLDEYMAGGYGKYNEEICRIISSAMKRNGIPLDPTYTGKAFWGMCEYLKNAEVINKNVLFIHTGGTPLFFDKLHLLQKAVE